MGRGAVTVIIIAAVLALGAGGCSTSGNGLSLVRPPAPPSSAPTPDSPEAALRLFEWSYNNRAISGCRGLFTADYRFYFSPLDSAGAAYRGTPWTRDDELISTAHLFGGSADPPSASSIRLDLDQTFIVVPDPRSVAWDAQGRWHKNIRTQVVLNVQTGDGNAIDISGAASFYLVRSDSAAIPIGVAAVQARPDTTRWWINRWDDETAQAGPTPAQARGRDADVLRRPVPLDAQASSSKTWGSLKVVYR